MRVRLLRAALVTLAAPCLLTTAAPLRQSSGADIVLVGGRIYTGNSDQPRVEALAIRGDRVAAVGNNKIILTSATARTRVIDLAGRMAMPGINDAHDTPATSRSALSQTAELRRNRTRR